jgi:hypothetical protein
MAGMAGVALISVGIIKLKNGSIIETLMGSITISMNTARVRGQMIGLANIGHYALRMKHGA